MAYLNSQQYSIGNGETSSMIFVLEIHASSLKSIFQMDKSFIIANYYLTGRALAVKNSLT